MIVSPLPWTQVQSDSELTMTLDTAVYSLEAIQRACYWLADRCYVFLEPAEPAEGVRARVVLKDPQGSLQEIAGEFGNRILDEQLRRQIADETRTVRDFIVTQAFAEADIGDSRSGNYIEDPENIGR